MSLAAKLPPLDDRTFDNIVAEARQRIPRYTAEWTDFNDGDTGIALLELFGWMTEMLIFRMNQTPELSYLKFLELIGIRLEPARPATAYVSLAVEAGFAQATVDVPSRTQFSATGAAGPIIFESERRLVAFAPVLDRVLVSVGGMYTDQTAANAGLAAGLAPFGEFADPGSALVLGFAYDGAFPVRTELCLTSFAMPGAGTGAVACGQPVASGTRIVWECFDGRDWYSLSLLKDETDGFTRTGQIFLKTPEADKLRSARLQPGDDRPRYWLRARLERFDLQKAPRLLAIRANAVPVSQGETIEGEILGGSNAQKGQVFRLANRPVLDGTLMLEIDEGQGFKAWAEVDDFLESEPGPDRVRGDAEAIRERRFYLLDRSEGEVFLSDGPQAHIPVANVQRPRSNVRARSYRFGGGSGGNVAAGAISTMLTAVPGIDAAQVSNPLAAAGGSDEESLDSAKQRAGLSLRARGRAVTAADFEVIAKSAGPVARVKALPLYHPDFPQLPVPGVVTAVVVPEPSQAAVRDAAGEADAESRGLLMPQPGLLRQVCAVLDCARLLTTEVYVIPPVYREVVIHAELIPDGTVDEALLKQNAVAALDTLFHPLRGGLDGTGWPFGGSVYFSWVHRALLLPGVSRLGSVTIEIDGEDYATCTDVALPGPATLLFSGSHDVNVLTGSVEAVA